MKKNPIDENIAHIWKVGFPSDKNRDEAIAEAEAMARANGINGPVVRTEIVETPEHIANNEYLVVIYFGPEQ